MLSVLIPTYNCQITQLVNILHKQTTALNIAFEIIVFDDCSTNKETTRQNQRITALKNTYYTILSKNLGRSAIRNALAKQAKYDLLLFIDAGTIPKSNSFIKNYIDLKVHKIASGGMTFLEIPPQKPNKLRWLYTKRREFKALCSSNFIIQKEVFLSHPFDETIKTYGYEDVLFFNTLKQHQFKIHFFNNPVIHNADDNAKIFIKKTETALNNLVLLYKKKKISPEQVKLLHVYLTLKSLKIAGLTSFIFKIVRPLVLINLNSNNPSILLFDFYRIGYLCRH
ncbi:hypothetical protein PK35_11655 [Tamlana nanhaiensis]|uniref:Glycosyltransferase 2-like domain-containing protein n=1 Tax=Neotamlana nanhaiensis TaxID=1382798 RepID=A0A0D7W0N9_9FLAO|nr:glycosyltransferase family A protein [Tamlana nanhaiensis]KJD32086.1 hypothetical protein PK35_10770 [Tamlana nanhaiensis]KJD32248.1 hypothetical protein PK35_11655 [Tamlana nanhaiensis]